MSEPENSAEIPFCNRMDLNGDDSLQTRKRKLTSAVWNHFEKQNVDGVVKVNYSFDQLRCRRQLVRMIILHEYPLLMVHHVGFREFLNTLQPLFKLVTRNTIKRDILKLYDNEKDKAMCLLDENESRIAITVNMWTTKQKKSFMAITAHFIDDSWQIRTRAMRFKSVPCPHTSELLSTTLLHCLMDWNVDLKLSILTINDCTTKDDDDMISLLLGKLSNGLGRLLLDGEFLRIPCCTHVLNLIANEALRIISESVEKIRESIAFWTATPKRVATFERTARQMDISCGKKLDLDCETRWNSTYLMLHIALQYKDVFPRLQLKESEYDYLPSDQDWNLVNEFCERLSLFFLVTELFNESKYLTASDYFPHLCELKLSIRDWSESPCAEFRMIASNVIEQFDEYWNDTYRILAAVTVLDPRFKLKLADFFFREIFGEEASNQEVENVLQICKKLIKNYEKNDPKENVVQSSTSHFKCETSSDSGNKNRMTKFYRFLDNISRMQIQKTDLDRYLEEPVLCRSDDFDLLAWWKVNSVIYPTLQKVARDLIAIPVSTVASESAFDINGRVISPQRSRFEPKTLEALICTKDWLWAEIHEQSASSYSRCTGSCDSDIKEESSFDY